MSKLALGPTQPLHKWAVGFSPRLNLLASGAVHLPPSSAKVKNEWRYTFTPCICLHGTWRERLTLYHTYSPSPPASINTPDSTPLLCPCKHYGISGFHWTNIFLIDNLPTSGSGSQNITLSRQFATQSQLVYPGPSSAHGYNPTDPTMTFMSPTPVSMHI